MFEEENDQIENNSSTVYMANHHLEQLMKQKDRYKEKKYEPFNIKQQLLSKTWKKKGFSYNQNQLDEANKDEGDPFKNMIITDIFPVSDK